jgi:hypothetical protein
MVPIVTHLCSAGGVTATETRHPRSPLAVPDVYQSDGGLRRIARAGRPPTLGDKLNEVMRQRSQTTEAAARAMEVPSDMLLAWSADHQVPDHRHDAALMGYLQVDEHQLRGLVLRGQMRRTQALIRN